MSILRSPTAQQTGGKLPRRELFRLLQARERGRPFAMFAIQACQLEMQRSVLRILRNLGRQRVHPLLQSPVAEYAGDRRERRQQGERVLPAPSGRRSGGREKNGENSAHVA